MAYELFEEAFCVQTDVECPHCESNLLYDQEREVDLCPDCRGEFVDNVGSSGFPLQWSSVGRQQLQLFCAAYFTSSRLSR